MDTNSDLLLDLISELRNQSGNRIDHVTNTLLSLYQNESTLNQLFKLYENTTDIVIRKYCLIIIKNILKGVKEEINYSFLELCKEWILSFLESLNDQEIINLVLYLIVELVKLSGNEWPRLVEIIFFYSINIELAIQIIRNAILVYFPQQIVTHEQKIKEILIEGLNSAPLSCFIEAVHLVVDMEKSRLLHSHNYSIYVDLIIPRIKQVITNQEKELYQLLPIICKSNFFFIFPPKYCYEFIVSSLKSITKDMEFLYCLHYLFGVILDEAIQYFSSPDLITSLFDLEIEVVYRFMVSFDENTFSVVDSDFSLIINELAIRIPSDAFFQLAMNRFNALMSEETVESFCTAIYILSLSMAKGVYSFETVYNDAFALFTNSLIHEVSQIGFVAGTALIHTVKLFSELISNDLLNIVKFCITSIDQFPSKEFSYKLIYHFLSCCSDSDSVFEYFLPFAFDMLITDPSKCPRYIIDSLTLVIARSNEIIYNHAVEIFQTIISLIENNIAQGKLLFRVLTSLLQTISDLITEGHDIFMPLLYSAITETDDFDLVEEGIICTCTLIPFVQQKTSQWSEKFFSRFLSIVYNIRKVDLSPNEISICSESLSTMCSIILNNKDTSIPVFSSELNDTLILILELIISFTERKAFNQIMPSLKLLAAPLSQVSVSVTEISKSLLQIMNTLIEILFDFSNYDDSLVSLTIYTIQEYVYRCGIDTLADREGDILHFLGKLLVHSSISFSYDDIRIDEIFNSLLELFITIAEKTKDDIMQEINQKIIPFLEESLTKDKSNSIIFPLKFLGTIFSRTPIFVSSNLSDLLFYHIKQMIINEPIPEAIIALRILSQICKNSQIDKIFIVVNPYKQELFDLLFERAKIEACETEYQKLFREVLMSVITEMASSFIGDSFPFEETLPYFLSILPLSKDYQSFSPILVFLPAFYKFLSNESLIEMCHKLIIMFSKPSHIIRNYGIDEYIMMSVQTFIGKLLDSVPNPEHFIHDTLEGNEFKINCYFEWKEKYSAIANMLSINEGMIIEEEIIDL